MIINTKTEIETIPNYVKEEAKATIAKSFTHGNLGRTIRFIAISDAHNTLITANHPTSTNKQNIIQGNTDVGRAIKYIADRIGLDFVANLGDSALVGETEEAYTISEIGDEIMNFNQKISDGFNGIPNIRIVGNHDETYSTTSSARLWNSGAYNLYGRFSAGVQDGKNGYGYYDFVGQKVRVIYLNTSDSDSATSSGTLIAFSQVQKNWLCETLIDTNAKTDAAEWKILLISHVPLDFGAANISTDILVPYVNGGSYGSYTFSNNSAEIIGNCHGHMHCFNVGYMGDKIRRWCTPNACYMFNNHYGSRSEYAPWVDSVTYNKTANSGDNTAFSLVTIDLDNNMAYVDNYGAGIDREFTTDYKAPSVTNLLETVGYMENTRISSTGVAKADSRGAGYYTLNFTGVTSGDVIRIKGMITSGASESYCALYSAENEDGFITGSASGLGASATGNVHWDDIDYDAETDVLSFVINDSNCFVRFSFKPSTDIAACIITKNEEIPV